MPAYSTEIEYNENEQKEIFKIGIKKIHHLISVPTAVLDNEIDKFLQADIINIKNNSKAKVYPSFIAEIESRSLLYTDELSEMVVKPEDYNLIVDNAAVKSNTNVLSPMSIISQVATKTYGIVNSTAASSRWIACTVNWQHDALSRDIVYLAPSTSVGSVYPAFCTQSYDPSRQVIVNNYANSTDYAFVHKRSTCTVAGGYPNPVGELIVDFVLKGDGTSTLYAGYEPYGTHNWSGPY